jgi:hypothetical protein
VKQPAKKAASVLRNKATSGDAARVIADLKAHPGNRPSDRKALENHTVSVLQNKVTKQVVQAVIADLERQEIVSYDGKKIVYKFPKAKK